MFFLKQGGGYWGGKIEEYPIQGKKSLDFAGYKKVAELIRNKEHLTLEGFNRILEIKARMNKPSA